MTASINTPVYSTTEGAKYTVHESRTAGVTGIRKSCYPAEDRLSVVIATDRPISYGDRLFARLVMHGRTVVEVMVNSVSDLSELWGELRRQCRGMRGLAKLYLRNASRGWSMERHLMFYPDRRFSSAISSAR